MGTKKIEMKKDAMKALRFMRMLAAVVLTNFN